MEILLAHKPVIIGAMLTLSFMLSATAFAIAATTSNSAFCDKLELYSHIHCKTVCEAREPAAVRECKRIKTWSRKHARDL